MRILYGADQQGDEPLQGNVLHGYLLERIWRNIVNLEGVIRIERRPRRAYGDLGKREEDEAQRWREHRVREVVDKGCRHIEEIEHTAIVLELKSGKDP